MKNEYCFNDTLYPCLFKDQILLWHHGKVIPINDPPPKNYWLSQAYPYDFHKVVFKEREQPTQHINQPRRKIAYHNLFCHPVYEDEFTGEGEE